MSRNALNRISLGFALAAGLTVGGALAQDAKPPARNPQVDERPEVIVSPEIGAERPGDLPLKAPKASEVLLNASIGEKTPKPPGTVKDAPDSGTCPCKGRGRRVVGHPDDGAGSLRYAFLVDGVRALDLANPDIKGRRRHALELFRGPRRPAALRPKAGRAPRRGPVPHLSRVGLGRDPHRRDLHPARL